MIVMRLLSSLKHDESERGIYKLGHSLVKSGHQSIVISSAHSKNELVQRLERDGNIYHRIPMQKKSWLSLLQIFKLRSVIETHMPDIIHVHSRTPAWVLYWALRGLKVEKKPKVVTTIYGFYPINSYSKALLSSDVIISVSDSVTEYLEKKLAHIKHPPIVRIYRGVNTRYYPYRYNPSVFWLRQTFAEYPELEHKKWILFPSVIGNEYGQEWLIDILGNLQEHAPNIHVIIMDDDKEEGGIIYTQFRQRAFALELDKFITFIGKNRNDMRDWLSASNLVVALANQPESIGMPILQALHLGTPVIGWNKAAYSEILSVMYPQGLVKKYDAHAVTKAVKRELSVVSHPPISNSFTMKKTINKTVLLYNMMYLDQEIPKSIEKLTETT